MTNSRRGATKRKYVRLTPAAWATIDGLWQAGETTLAELSERFGPSPRALQSHFAKANIVKGERAAAMAASVREEVLKEELGDPDLKVARAREIRERTFERANIVEDLIMQQLQLAQRDPTQVLRAGAALKMLSLAAGSLERLHEVKKRALGLDRDSPLKDELTELVIRDLTQEDVDEMRRQQEEDDHSGGLIVDDEDDGGLPERDANDVIIETGVDDKKCPEPQIDTADGDGFRLVRAACN